MEIAREGREGKKIGTIFTVGDEKNVLKHSRPLILDPLYGHPSELKKLENADMRETTKELAQLDGAFIVTGEGELVGEVLPELWLIGRESLYIQRPKISENRDKNITVITNK